MISHATSACAMLAALGALGCARSHLPSEGELVEDRLAMAYCEAWSPMHCDVPWSAVGDVQICAWQRLRDAGRRRIDAIDEGAVRVDEEALRSCLDGMRCGEPEPEACAAITVGLTPLDGPCEDDVVCAPGLFCERSGGCGRCTPRRALGETCRRATECVASVEGMPVVCDRLTPEDLLGTCRAYRELDAMVPPGESCARIDVDPTHVEVPRCRAGLDCAADAMGEPFCRAEGGGLGSGCTVDSTCGENLVCEAGACVTGSVASEIDAPCNEVPEWGPLHRCDRRQNLVCVDRRCRSISNRNGGDCGFGGHGVCGAGLVCGGTRCMVPSVRDDGVGCVVDGDCRSGRCGLSHRCVPRSC